MALLKGIGKLIQIGVAKETTRGTTPAAATYWLATDDWSIEERYNNAVDSQTYGVVEDSVDETRVKDWAEGQISFPLAATTSAVFFLSLLGTDTPTTHAGETTVFDHLITVAQTAQHQSLSFYVHDPIANNNAYGTPASATADYSYANAVVHKLDIDYTLGNFVMCNASIMAKRGSAAAVVFAPSQTTIEPRFVPQYLTFKVATTAGVLSTGNVIKLKNAKISITENIESDDVMGSTSPRDFVNKEFTVQGTIEAIWQNEIDFKAAALTDSSKALRFDLINSDVNLGVVPTNPEVKIDLARVTFEELSRPVKIKDIVYQTLKFKAHYSVSDAYMIKVTFTNMTASY